MRGSTTLFAEKEFSQVRLLRFDQAKVNGIESPSGHRVSNV